MDEIKLTIWEECETQGQLAQIKGLFEETGCGRSDHAPNRVNNAAEDKIQQNILLDQELKRLNEGASRDLFPDNGLSGLFHVRWFALDQVNERFVDAAGSH